MNDAVPHTRVGQLTTDLVLATFQLDAAFMDVAEGFAARGGITAAWWRVLGGTLDRPSTVGEISRSMGVARQGIQRIANVLVERGLAEFRQNPAHRRAKLLACTREGRASIELIAAGQRPWADGIGKRIGEARLNDTLATLQLLLQLVTADQGEPVP